MLSRSKILITKRGFLLYIWFVPPRSTETTFTADLCGRALGGKVWV